MDLHQQLQEWRRERKAKQSTSPAPASQALARGSSPRQASHALAGIGRSSTPTSHSEVVGGSSGCSGGAAQEATSSARQLLLSRLGESSALGAFALSSNQAEPLSVAGHRSAQLVDQNRRALNVDKDRDPNAWEVQDDEVHCLQMNVREADAQVAALEAQLWQQRQLRQQRLDSNDDSARGVGSGSEASTAAPSVAEEAYWQERAGALEREIRAESATALELQDRIHWLRGQLRRQPGLQNEQILEVRSLLGRIKSKVDAARPPPQELPPPQRIIAAA